MCTDVQEVKKCVYSIILVHSAEFDIDLLPLLGGCLLFSSADDIIGIAITLRT